MLTSIRRLTAMCGALCMIGQPSFAASPDEARADEESGAALGTAATAERPGAERDDGSNQSPYVVKASVEAPLLVAGFAMATASLLYTQETIRPWCGLNCDLNDINALDRPSALVASQAAADASDYLFFTSMGLPFILDAIDVGASRPHDGWRGYGTDSVVFLEVLAANYWLNNLVAVAVRRPRPIVYNPDVSDDLRLAGTSALSFYSGHVATAFGTAAAYSRLFMLRHPHSPLVVPVWAVTHAIAVSVGILRVRSGSHFPTDVVVGALIGSSIGVVIPSLHARSGDQRRASQPNGAEIRMRPYFNGKTAGVAATFQ